MDAIELDERAWHESAHDDLDPLDIESALLSLTGGSVVDWSGVRFHTYEEVNHFLRLWHCDIVRHVWARERLRYLYNQAVNYLEDHVGLTIRAEVRRPKDVRDAFLRASIRGRFHRDQIQYCAVLKLMHVINHLEMQELRSQCSIREVDLIELANHVVLQAAGRMREEGFPLRAFFGNRKTRPSVITKLLAKREATAATIYDKLRFRLITERREEVVPALAWLFRHVIPFPTITPGESHNSLLGPADLAALLRRVPDAQAQLASASEPHANPYSGRVYKMINFIAGLPVRIFDLPGVQPPANRALLGEAVLVSVEFQVVDAETDRENEKGEACHELYKRRQMDRVCERLGRSAGAPR